MTNNPSLADRVIRGIDAAIIGLASVALVAMMLHISIDILAGLLFNAPIVVTSAIVTQYYMIAVAFLPLAAGELRGAHISVDLFVSRLGAAPRRWLNCVVLPLCVGIYGGLAIQAWQLAMEKLASNAFLLEQTTRLSVWPSYFMVPVGFGLIALLITLKFYLLLLGRAEPTLPLKINEEKPHERYGDV